MKNIKFDERFDEEDSNITTLYFVAPKEKLNKYFNSVCNEAISMEISLEFPLGNIDPSLAFVSVSPTRECEGGLEEYDWLDVDIPLEEVEELIEIYKLAS